MVTNVLITLHLNYYNMFYVKEDHLEQLRDSVMVTAVMFLVN